MGKELKIKRDVSKDWRQIYIDDQPTGIYISNEGKIKSKAFDHDLNDNVKIKSSNIVHIDAEEFQVPTKLTSYIQPNSSKIGTFTLEVDEEGDLNLFNSSGDSQNNINITSANHLLLKADTGKLVLYDGSDHANFQLDGEYLYWNGSNSDAGDGFRVRVEANGVTTISTNHYALGGSSDAANMTLQPDGHLVFTAATDHHIKMERGAGFQQQTVTYDATDTNVDFKDGNKAYLALTGNVTDLNLYFPAVSGNFVLVVKQDGSTRTISNYKAFDSLDNAATGSSTVKFSGGSNPDLTDGGNKVDILSFYWDASNEIAYGVASLNF